MSGTGRRDGGRGFDRIKPPERRLMERPSGPRLDSDEVDAEGRAALFSSGPARDRARERERARRGSAGRGHREGAGRTDAVEGLAVHCSRCDATSPLDPGTAVKAALPLFLVVPWRDHPVFATCPACRHRAWLRIET